MLDQPMMPWQQYVADVGCEIDPATGMPAYREVIFTVPRQSGKTTISLSWQIDRCLNWGRPQRSVFTAQTGKDARDKWIDELFPLLKSKLKPLVTSINKGMGNESMMWATGSLIRLGSTSASSGHGKTIDQAVLDEIWHDADDRREQSLRPAMITRPDAQLIVCSTAGTQASTVYNRKVKAGRRSALEDPGSGIAYFEWSAPDDWDPDDEDSWWGFMPALGHTIAPASIRVERASMLDGEFRRAYGNVPTAGADMLIPAPSWAKVCNPAVKPAGRLSFGMDVAEDRSSAAIAAADGQTVEVVDHRPGTGWVTERCNELVARWGGKVALDFRGPAGVLADGIAESYDMPSLEVVQACGDFYDAVVEQRVAVRADGALDAAVEGVVKKQVGDNFVWSRRSSVSDVTPLYAVTLAHALSQEDEPTPAQVHDWPDEDEIAAWEEME